jgi:tetratricopeptide (TPR) repeat protein
MPRGRLGILAILGAIGATSALAQHDIDDHEIQRAQRFASKGSKALRAGNFGAALPMFQKALEAVPAFPDAHMGIGHVALKDRSYERALEAYRSAEQGYTALGEALFRRRVDEYDRAQEQIRNLRQELTELRARANRAGTNESEPGLTAIQIEQSISHLELLKRPNPGDHELAPAEVPFFIGNALMHLGRYGEAIDSWRETVRRDPKFAPAYNNLAVAFWKTGRPGQARACVARAEELGVEANPAFKADLERTGNVRAAANCP